MRFLLLYLIFTPLFHSLTIVFYLSLVGKSHLDFVSALINMLVERGHEVDLILARQNTLVEGHGTGKTTRVLSFGFPEKSPWMKIDHLRNPFQPKKSVNILFEYTRIATDLCRHGLKSGEPIRFLEEKKYDIGISSDYDFCGFVLFHHAGIDSVLSYTSTGLLPHQALSIGLPSPASCISSIFDVAPGTSKRSILERTWNFIKAAQLNFFERGHLETLGNNMVQEFFGPQFPPVGELVRNIDIVFVNSNEIIEKPRPLSHKVKYIGGAALPKAKPVTKELDGILSKSRHAVIFSFGTQIPTKNIPLNIRKNFVEAFKKFPQITFMWKYDVQNDEENIFLNVTNVNILKWMPQTDLLGDRRVIGFISHMGLNSLLEASYAGIPILAVPIFSDQAHNAQIGVDRGTTVIVNKDELTSDNIENALKKLLYDTRYRDNAIRISSLLKNKPEDVKSKFVNWVEYAAQHKRLHKIMNLPGNDFGVISYYCIDCALLLFVIITVSIGIIYKILYQIITISTSFLLNRKKPKMG